MSINSQYHYGQCYCGDCTVKVITGRPLVALQPRRCDCRFCRLHGLVYLSDPDGRLEVRVAQGTRMKTYRQGSGAALFYLCGRCAVVVCVTFNRDAQVLSAVNAMCLTGDVKLADAVAVSPKTLDQQTKIERWSALWFPETVFVSDP